jgi:hypothetical protein
LEWYTNLKQELLCKSNLSIELEFEAFAKAINNFKEYGYSAPLLIKDLKEFESLKKQINQTRQEVHLNQKVIQDLQKEISQSELQYYNYTLTMNNYHELEKIDFGLNELKQLKGLYTEISVANNIDPSEAGRRFFKEMEKNYENRLGLELKINELQTEIKLLNNKISDNQYYLYFQDAAAPNPVTLYSSGLTKNDIIELTDLVLALEGSSVIDYKYIRKDNEYF